MSCLRCPRPKHSRTPQELTRNRQRAVITHSGRTKYHLITGFSAIFLGSFFRRVFPPLIQSAVVFIFIYMWGMPMGESLVSYPLGNHCSLGHVWQTWGFLPLFLFLSCISTFGNCFFKVWNYIHVYRCPGTCM